METYKEATFRDIGLELLKKYRISEGHIALLRSAPTRNETASIGEGRHRSAQKQNKNCRCAKQKHQPVKKSSMLEGQTPFCKEDRTFVQDNLSICATKR